LTSLEKEFFSIGNLEDNIVRNLPKSSILQDHRKSIKTIDSLEYLLDFLDAYNFGDTSKSQISDKNETLISSSILGLFFEKINSYKDGAYFTPSYITMYMAKDTIRKAIVNKFNEKYNREIDSFESLINFCDRQLDKEGFLKDSNQIINSITICDPAVGSGHFLVSCLNELIVCKNELGILADDNNKILKCDILITNDELYIKSREDGDLIHYKLDENKENIEFLLKIQKTIFQEKYQIITKQLFGTDININATNITKLRLWIELLKSSYYDKRDNFTVLPNIDINIKSGNSLLSNFSLDENFKEDIFYNNFFNEYRELTNQYKICKVKSDRNKIAIKIDKLKQQIIQLNVINYFNAFEWRYEFPEILDSKGNFIGFDIVIGNPPYIMEDTNKEAFIGLNSLECYQGKTDIWHLFTCKGIDLLKEHGMLCFIAKNQWLESMSASKMRNKIYKNTQIKKIIDFGTNMIFDGVGQQTMILQLLKTNKNSNHIIDYKKFITKIDNKDIELLLNANSDDNNVKHIIKEIEKDYDCNKNLVFSDEENELILKKIEDKTNFIFDEKKEIIQGIIGGPDKAFIIKQADLNNFNIEERKFIKMFYTHTDSYYTPETDKYIIYSSKKNFRNKKIENYPNIKNKLSEYKKQLDGRRETIKGSIKWFHLWWARNESFFKDGEKIIFSSRTKGKNFTFAEKLFYGSRNMFFIKSNRVNLKYVTALLNSNIIYFYMKNKLKHTGDLLQIDKNQFMKIPIFISKKHVNTICSLVDEIILLKQQDKNYIQLENKLNILFYEAYNLNANEIKIIENQEL